MSHRVLIVEDHNLLRHGLRSMITALPGYEVVGEAREGKEAIREALSSHPDMILMDLSLPGMNGIEATAQIKRRMPEIRILMLTVYKTDEYVTEALRVGADGYVLKDASYDEFVIAIQTVANGKKYICPDVSMHLINDFPTLGDGANTASERLDACSAKHHRGSLRSGCSAEMRCSGEGRICAWIYQEKLLWSPATVFGALL